MGYIQKNCATQSTGQLNELASLLPFGLLKLSNLEIRQDFVEISLMIGAIYQFDIRSGLLITIIVIKKSASK